MSTESTKHMISAYEQTISPTMFLSGLFRSPAENFYASESVEIDIERDDEDVSIVIQDLSAGGRNNAADLYTNKEFKPPIHDEKGPINAWDLIKRNPGDNPFQAPDFQRNATARAMKLNAKMLKKIQRAIELQASQLLTTGKLELGDGTNVLYELDYKPKTAHFPTASVAWDDASNDMTNDLLSLANVIRNNGKQDPDQIIMGEGSFEAMVRDPEMRKRYETRRIDLGTIAPMQMRGQGGNYRGTLEIGNYRYDIWTYGGRYKAPGSGTITNYLPDDKVVMRSSTGRLDATFGAIPMIVQPENRVLPFLPSRVSLTGRGTDMFMDAWVGEGNKQVFTSVAARPLLIPTAIDTYGCLDTAI